jgi:hypothetical protein
MSRTDHVTVTLINSSDFTIDLQAEFGKDDWAIAPKFPESVGQFTMAAVEAEAYYYRKTVPVAVTIKIGETSLVFTHDPYQPKNQFGQAKAENWTVGYVGAQLEGYNFLVAIWSTKHSSS